MTPSQTLPMTPDELTPEWLTTALAVRSPPRWRPDEIKPSCSLRLEHTAAERS